MPPRKTRTTVRPATPVVTVPASPPYHTPPTSPSQIVKRILGDTAVIDNAKQYASELLHQHHDAERNTFQQKHDRQIVDLTKTLKVTGQDRKNEIIQLAHEEDIALTKELESNLEWERNMKYASLAVIVFLVLLCLYLDFIGKSKPMSKQTPPTQYMVRKW